jgi:hypothetical protein
MARLRGDKKLGKFVKKREGVKSTKNGIATSCHTMSDLGSTNLADLLMCLDPVLYNAFRLANSSRKECETMLKVALKVGSLKTMILPAQDFDVIKESLQMEYCRVNKLDPARRACLAAIKTQTTQSNAATRYTTDPATTTVPGPVPGPVKPGLPVKSKRALKQAAARGSRQ